MWKPKRTDNERKTNGKKLHSMNNELRDDILSTISTPLNYDLRSLMRRMSNNYEHEGTMNSKELGTFSSKTLDFLTFFDFFVEKCVSDAAKWLKMRTFVG